MAVTVPANTTVEAKSRQVTVTTAGGQSATSTISQAAGDAALEVLPASITLEADGTAVEVTVTSNTSWTVE